MAKRAKNTRKKAEEAENTRRVSLEHTFEKSIAKPWKILLHLFTFKTPIVL